MVGPDLVVTLQEIGQCEVVTTPVVQRWKKITKTVQPVSWQGFQSSPIVLALGAGLTTASLGGFMFADADNLAMSNSSTDTSQSPGDYRTSGATLLGLGGILIGIGAIDALRSTDSEMYLGVVRGTPTSEVRECYAKPAADVVVALRLDGRTLPRRRAGPDGRLRIPLQSIAGVGTITQSDSLDVTVDGAPNVNIPLSDEVVAAARAASAPTWENQEGQRPTERTPEDREPVRAASDTLEKDSGSARPTEDSSTIGRVSDLINRCKGTGGPGDVARAYAAYRVIDENRLGPETTRDLEAKVVKRCATNREQVGDQ